MWVIREAKREYEYNRPVNARGQKLHFHALHECIYGRELGIIDGSAPGSPK